MARTQSVSKSYGDSYHHRLSVLDEGPGIAPEMRTRIFEEFFKTPDNNKPGSGLGLNLVKKFVEAHNGDINVGASPPGGADFSIALPVPK